MAITIFCPHCRRRVSLPSNKAFRGNVISCGHCGKQFELIGGLLAEVFWAANQR